MENKMELRFPGISENESFARTCAASFASQLDPTLEQIADIKTAISEAVTNAVVHAYGGEEGEVILRCSLESGVFFAEIEDMGIGIKDIELAKTPFYTSADTSERSGMGFTVMEAFMDSVEVFSVPNKGTKVVMRKRIRP